MPQERRLSCKICALQRDTLLAPGNYLTWAGSIYDIPLFHFQWLCVPSQIHSRPQLVVAPSIFGNGQADEGSTCENK